MRGIQKADDEDWCGEPEIAAGSGLRRLPVKHSGNDSESLEQAGAIAALVDGLLEAAPTCRTPEQMRLANGLCRYLELARPAS